MYPDDRVLIAYVPSPADFKIIQQEKWYRLRYSHAPAVIDAEYIGFYFGKSFGEQKWAIHYFADIRGHELARRLDLFPHADQHPRANEIYYKLQVGTVRQLPHPILNLRWRRLLFLMTTWDRFSSATEIRDLVIRGGSLTGRRFTVMRETAE